MKLPSPLRLALGVIIVAAGVALVWWLVGYQIGKGMLSGTDATAFKKAYGFDEGAFLRLVLFAIIGAVTVVLASGKWPVLAFIAFAATILSPDRSAGATVGMIFFVLCAAGIAEMTGGRQILVALVAAIAIAAAFTLEGPFGRSEIAVVAALRAAFWFLPLFVLPDYVDRLVLKRLGV